MAREQVNHPHPSDNNSGHSYHPDQYKEYAAEAAAYPEPTRSQRLQTTLTLKLLYAYHDCVVVGGVQLENHKVVS